MSSCSAVMSPMPMSTSPCFFFSFKTFWSELSYSCWDIMPSRISNLPKTSFNMLEVAATGTPSLKKKRLCTGSRTMSSTEASSPFLYMR